MGDCSTAVETAAPPPPVLHTHTRIQLISLTHSQNISEGGVRKARGAGMSGQKHSPNVQSHTRC